MKSKTARLLREAYQRMHEHFGSLGWWPAKTPFEVIVGAILTQNTAWKNVEKAIANLRLARSLTPRKLDALPFRRLARLLRPAGYFRVKARRLKNFLTFFLDEFDGDIRKMRRKNLQRLREKLLGVSGIGPETADSILLYALEKPVFVVDAYTRRILCRHYLCKEDTSYEELQKLFMEHLPKSIPIYNEYHAELVNIGKDFCRKVPRCETCPLNGWNW